MCLTVQVCGGKNLPHLRSTEPQFSWGDDTCAGPLGFEFHSLADDQPRAKKKARCLHTVVKASRPTNNEPRELPRDTLVNGATENAQLIFN